MPTKPQTSPRLVETDSQNVAQRLKCAIRDAKKSGFDVRQVVLEDQHPGWCRLGNKMVIFLDLTSTTSDQFHQIQEIMASISSDQPHDQAA